VIALGPNNEPVVDMVTTWNKRCGIFAYSNFLLKELKKITISRVIDIPEGNALSPYFAVLGARTARSKALVHVQFAYGEFSGLKIWKSKRLSTFTAVLFYGGLTFSNCHVVTTFHELMNAPRVGGKAGTVYSKAMNKLICNVSDLIIVHTQENKRIMETVYGVDASKIKIIPMGTPENPVFLNQDECKKSLGLYGKRIIVLPGFVSRHKGHNLIIQILPKLGADVHLLIAGGAKTKEDSAYLEELKTLGQKFGCSDRITFNDDFPIPATVLNSADIALLPYTSASESMALRLLVAYQIPTVTSDLIVFRELYETYRCVELFKTSDADDLLVKTQDLLSNERKRRRLKEKCREMWSATKWSSIAAKHVETYMEVFSAHPDTLYESERQKERLDWLKNNLSGNSLEIGCATGYVADYSGVSVGLDLNVYRLRLAKRRYHGKDFVLSNAMYLPFKEKAFETVLIPEILEHLPLELAGKIVLEARYVGERLLITLPNADKVNYDKSIVEAPEHLWFPTKELVQKIVKDCQIDYSKEKDFMFVSV
jgi:glycosyltransferase involved in cell wall biosynthesis